MPSLWPGKTVRGFPDAKTEMRGLRPGLCVHRYGRWPRHFHHYAGRCDRRGLRADCGGQVSAAVLAACSALVAAHPRHHAVAVTLDEGASDRAAIPSQGSARPSRAQMTATVARHRLGFGLFTLVMTAAFIGLGVWQLQRRVEKHALIAALTERLAATPLPLPPPAQWAALKPANDEFRRVHFRATYGGPDAMVYSSGSAIRDDVAGPGA